jgi:hypothetical protein
MPHMLLAENNVGTRWMGSRMEAQERESSLALRAGADAGAEAEAGLSTDDDARRWSDLSTASSRSSSLTASVMLEPTRRRKLRGTGARALPVMFGDDMVAELRPKRWRDATPLGKGGFGTVYRASWRGMEVAVKEIALPPEPKVASAEAREELRKNARQVVADFVQEVEVCCDLNHPNLVCLMGYATKPRLLIVQELLLGQVRTARMPALFLNERHRHPGAHAPLPLRLPPPPSLPPLSLSLSLSLSVSLSVSPPSSPPSLCVCVRVCVRVCV